MESDFELKPHHGDERDRRDSDLSTRIAAACEGRSIRSVAQLTRYHPESVRRYFNGAGRIPADFIGQLAGELNLNAHNLLVGTHKAPNEAELRLVTTDRLINELGRRIQMIEDCAVGSVIVKNSFLTSRD